METLRDVQSIRAISDKISDQLGHISGALIPSGKRGLLNPWAVIGMIAVVVGGTYAGVKLAQDDEPQNLQFVDSSGQVVDKEGLPVESVSGINVAIASACPDDQEVDFQARIKNDKKTGTVQYLNATGYLQVLNGENDPLSYIMGNTSSYATAITPVCDGKTQYKFTTVAENETSFTMEEVINEDGLFRANYKRTFEAEKFGRLTVKAKDIIGDAWVYDDSDASNTDYDEVPVTFKSTTDNSTATSLAADTQMQWEFWLKTPSGSQYGEDELPLYVAVDADTTDYQIPTLSLSGVGLVDVKDTGELNSIDLSVLSAYEYVFKAPDGMRFGSANKVLTLDIISKAGVDPDVDILVRPLAVTRYLSQDGVTIKEGIFKDDSGNTEAASALSQEITVDIS